MSEKITFILGAGSNKDYGFPLGFDLYKMTIKDLENLNTEEEEKSELFKILRHFNLIMHIDVFRNKLEGSQFSSLDEFVYHYPEYEKIVRYIISYYIIWYEDNSKLLELSNENHWYRSFWKNIKTYNFEDLPKGKYGFITFNYDRSLEAYFTEVMYNTYFNQIKKDRFEIYNLLNDYFPIYHVYGHLGKLYANGRNSFEYGAKRSASESILRSNFVDKINFASRQIELIFSKRQEKPELQKIFKRLENSDKIIFLGFGFDDLNLENLKIKELNKTKIGYVRGLSTKRVKQLKSIYNINCNTIHIDNIVEYLKRIEII